MITDRPYALAMPTAAAIAELHRMSGTQFDPRVVAAFVHAWHEAQHPLEGTPDDALRAA